MKIKKLLALLLTSLIVLASLTACNIGNPEDTDSSSESSTQAPNTQESTSQSGSEDDIGKSDNVNDLSVHDIFKNGVPQYTIIRPDDAGSAVTDVGKYLYENMSALNKSESRVGYATDLSAEYLKTKQHDPSAKEILVGMTNYDETKAAMADLGYGEYIIKTVGNKIVITGWSDGAVQKAAEYFVRSLMAASDKNNLSLNASDIAVKKTYNELLNRLPTYDFADTELQATYDSGDDCYLALINNATELTHDQYLTKLENEGYKKYTDNKIGDNLFATYTKGDVVINAGYYPVNNEERIIIEELGDRALPGLDSDNAYTKVCEPLFLQVGISRDDSSKANGMGYMFRLEDGTFLIYDGGHDGELSGEQPRQNARRLYELMKEYAPDPNNIVVKAWIITHAHKDHIGASRDFLSAYAKNDVKIEAFLLNFPTAEQVHQADNSTSQADDFLKKLAKYSPSTKIIKIHPGYKFYLANAEIEFLYTLELYAPSTLTYYNTSSLVSTVTICGQRFMMTGDMSENANAIIRDLYGKTLKSDFVQVAHHGAQGGSTQFYSLVDPTWAFWPVGRSGYESQKSNIRNKYMFTDGTNLKQTFVAFFQTTLVQLPFDGTNYTVTDNKTY